MHTNGEYRALQQAIEKIDRPVIFDIGANQGEWTASVLQIKPNARIHCFEPGREAFEKLNSLNFPEHVKRNKLGLGATPSIQKLGVYGGEGLRNSIYANELNKSPIDYEEITIDTISDYCQRNDISFIDFAKIDVEGYELEVLKGAEKMLRDRRIRYIQFEYNDTFIAARIFLRDVISFTHQFGYLTYKILPKGLFPISGYRTSLENFTYCNYLLELR
jgi:FkbM family methyltransferase